MRDGKGHGASRRVIWSITLSVVAIVLSLGVFNVVALPGCRSCHMRGSFRAATASAPHAKVDCRACHLASDVLGRLAFSSRQPLHMLVPVSGGSARDSAAVPDPRCLNCHADVLDRVVVADGVRFSHKSCATESSCSDCHSETAHGSSTRWKRVYEMDQCLACHISKAKTACDLCHEGRDAGSRTDSPTFRVTHGPQWRSTHGMGDSATCGVCHQPEDCAGCHGPGLPHGADFVQTHTQHAKAKDAKCETCHRPSFCEDCHETPMPHDRRFVEGHAEAATDAPASCKRCHADPDCVTCHDKHVHPGGAVGGAVSTMGGGR